MRSKSNGPPSSSLLLRFMVLPILFSACAWQITLRPAPVLPQSPLAVPWWSSKRDDGTHSIHNKYLIPDTLWDAFRLGEISVRMKNFRSEDTGSLLEEANDILNHKKQYNLTMEDITGGRLDAAIEVHYERQARYRIFQGAFSFVGVLSIISIVGIFTTLLPTLKFLYLVLHLDYLWHRLIHAAAWMLKVVDPLLGVISFSAPLLVVDQSLYFPVNGARSQMNILAAGCAVSAFFYHAWRREGTLFAIANQKHFPTVAFAWGFSFLVPLALVGTSQFLGFFSVGCIFGALGFVAFPMPFGWVAGFQDEASMDKCMITSMVITAFSVAAKMTSFPSRRVLEIFQLGLSVFGMLAFGLAGLIKSSRAVYDDKSFFGGPAAPLTFIYPISWLLIGFIGSLISYASLTNTAITFVCLWMSQFYWRIAGFTSVSIFVFSCILFYVTLQLRSHREFLESLLLV